MSMFDPSLMHAIADFDLVHIFIGILQIRSVSPKCLWLLFLPQTLGLGGQPPIPGTSRLTAMNVSIPIVSCSFPPVHQRSLHQHSLHQHSLHVYQPSTTQRQQHVLLHHLASLRTFR